MSNSPAKGEANQNLDIILTCASSEQKPSLLRWMTRTAAKLVEDQASDPASRKEINAGCWYRWLKLIFDEWEALAPKHSARATRDRSRLRLMCSEGKVIDNN